MDKFFCVYAMLDSSNEVFYIGISCNLQRRKKEHIFEAKRDNQLWTYCKLRKVLVEKKPKDIFVVLEDGISDDDIDDREIYYISKFREQGNTLTNLTNGGRSQFKMEDDVKKRMSNSRKGRVVSEGTKRKISESNMGKKFSKEHKKKLSKAWEDRIVTSETRKKMSKTSKGKINIKVFELIDPEGNAHITEKGLTLFCEENNLTTANMHKVIQGERIHHKGWTFIKELIQ